jgi:hypothetical protein
MGSGRPSDGCRSSRRASARAPVGGFGWWIALGVGGGRCVPSVCHPNDRMAVRGSKRLEISWAYGASDIHFGCAPRGSEFHHTAVRSL